LRDIHVDGRIILKHMMMMMMMMKKKKKKGGECGLEASGSTRGSTSGLL
jgi:hypothetical protein